MTCEELRELAAAYALGALEASERAEVERHLASPGPHQGCREAVDRARATAAELAHALPRVRPDRGVWRAIEARLGVRPRARSLGWAVAAAAAVLLVFLLIDAGRRRDEAASARAQAEQLTLEQERLRGRISALEGSDALQRQALALLDRVGTRLVPLDAQPGQAGSAVAIVNLAERRAIVTSTSLPAQVGKVYQLWVLRGAQAPVPAGFLQATAGATAGEVDRGALAGGAPDALAVSLEPAGGSPAPTVVVLVGKLAG